MSSIDPHERIDLSGPWAGFGFQRGHLFTPEGHQLEPCDMTWWSLTCNIDREWRAMMAEVSADLPNKCSMTVGNLNAGGRHRSGNGINLRDAVKARCERRFATVMAGPAAEPSNVVPLRRGPRPIRRG